MFTLDERIRGLPAAKEQVVAVYHSINSPHLAIPGKKAGPAQASIVGLRGTHGFAVFIYLYLPESQDCAVYASDRRGFFSTKGLACQSGARQPPRSGPRLPTDAASGRSSFEIIASGM